jgi:hypothetical protein
LPETRHQRLEASGVAANPMQEHDWRIVSRASALHYLDSIDDATLHGAGNRRAGLLE